MSAITSTKNIPPTCCTCLRRLNGKELDPDTLVFCNDKCFNIFSKILLNQKKHQQALQHKEKLDAKTLKRSPSTDILNPDILCTEHNLESDSDSNTEGNFYTQNIAKKIETAVDSVLGEKK